MTTTTQTQAQADALLRRVLYANSAFSIVSGLIFMLAPAGVADFLGLLGMAGSTFIAVIGIGILLFAAFVLYTATRERIKPRLAMSIIVMDSAWVLGSAVLLLTGALPLTTAGNWAVLIVADAVSVFAIIEYIGFRRIR